MNKPFMRFITGLLISAAFVIGVHAGGTSANVTLAWQPISNPVVAGYNIYCGRVGGVYTNKTCVGAATRLTMSNLVPGVTYYFAATTYSAAGAESLLSSEVSYTVPPLPPEVQLNITPARQFVLNVTGLGGHTCDVLATQDFKTWTVIGTVTVGVSGTSNFTDTNAASFFCRFYRTRDNQP